MKKSRNIAILTAAVMGGAALTACGAQGGTSQIQAGGNGVLQVQNVENQVISVSSSESVKVVPDMAEIVYGVYTQAADAKSCQDENGKSVDQVVETLKGLGIEESSIQTSGYDMNPIYDWNNGQTITGYEMNTMVTVSDIPLENVGDLLSGSVSAGINSVRSVTYLSSKYDERYQEALKKAVESAKVKAQAMSEAGGCTLGQIVAMEEFGGNSQARYTGYYSAKNSAAADESAPGAMAVMPGELEIEAQISVDFAVSK